MKSYKDARSFLSNIDAISRTINLDEMTLSQIRELKDLFRKYTDLYEEIEKTSSINIFKKRTLKKKFDDIGGDIQRLGEKIVLKIVEQIKSNFIELESLYEQAKSKMNLNVEIKKPILDLPPGDLVSQTNFLHEIALRYSKEYSQLKDTITSKVQSLWESNNLKFRTYKRFISFDIDQIPLSSQDTFPSKPINLLPTMYSDLLKEEKFLDDLKTRVKDSYLSILMSRLNNIEAYLEAIKAEGVAVQSFIYAKLSSLRRDMNEKMDISALQSFEKEINELEELIRDRVKREILQIRHAVRGLTEGIPNLPPPPQITGESLDKLIESLQETKVWRNEVFNTLVTEIKEILQDLESSYDKIIPPLRTEIEGSLYNFKDNLAKVTKIDDAVFLYKTVTGVLSQWRATLIKDLTSAYEDYQKALKLVREVLAHVPNFLIIELPENPSEKKFSELVTLLVAIREKTEKRDKIFKDALINELQQIKNQLENIPEPYDQFFLSLKSNINDIISKINEIKKTEEARLMYLRTTSEIQRTIEKIFDELKERLLLKTRLALAKIPNAPDISNALEKINEFVLSAEVDESIKQLINYYETSIVSRIKATLKSNLQGYQDIFSKLEKFGIKFDKQNKQLNNLQTQLENTTDLEVIGEIGRQFRNLISSNNVVGQIKSWIDIMTSQMGRALEGITPSAGEIESIISLISEGKSIDLTNPDQTINYVDKLIRVWDVVRKYIIKLEELEYNKFIETIKQTPNYDLVMKVYEAHKAQFSEKIYPLLALEELRAKFAETETPDIVDLLFEIRRLERGWFEKINEVIKWHKAVRVLMAGFDYSLSPSERKAKLKEIKKRIQTTYSKTDVVAYLNWLVEVMAGLSK